MGARGGGVWMTVAAVWAVVVVLLFIQGGAAAQEPPYDAQVSITSDTLRVRTGPSTNSAVMGGLPNGRGVRVLDRSDGWAYIQSGDTEGWVAERFLRPASDVGADRPAATPRPRASGRPGQACALGRLAVRSATPGMDARRLDGNRCLVSTSAGSVVVQRVVVREDGKQINIQALNQFTKQQTGHTFLPYLFFDAMSVFSAPEFLVGARPNLVWRADRD